MRFVRRFHIAIRCLVTFTLFGATPAFAVTCPFLVGATDEMDFGGPIIGSKYSSDAALGSTINSCTEQADDDYLYHDCGYVDEIGVQYTVWGARITRKDLTAETATNAAQFPFGISKTDDLQTVVGKLSAYPGNSHLWGVRFVEGEIVLGTHFCFWNTTGARYSFSVVFDRVTFQMTKIVARENW